VGEHGVDAIAEVDDHMVAHDPAGPGQFAQHFDRQQVEQAEGRGPAPVIPLAIVHPNHHAVCRGAHRLAEPGEVLRAPGQWPPGDIAIDKGIVSSLSEAGAGHRRPLVLGRGHQGKKGMTRPGFTAIKAGAQMTEAASGAAAGLWPRVPGLPHGGPTVGGPG